MLGHICCSCSFAHNVDSICKYGPPRRLASIRSCAYGECFGRARDAGWDKRAQSVLERSTSRHSLAKLHEECTTLCICSARLRDREHNHRVTKPPERASAAVSRGRVSSARARAAGRKETRPSLPPEELMRMSGCAAQQDLHAVHLRRTKTPLVTTVDAARSRSAGAMPRTASPRD